MNRASGSNGIPAELFQILKDAAAKVLHSLCQQIWKTQQWLQDWKMSFQSNPKFAMIHTVKCFSIANEAEVDASPEYSCFFL